MSKVNNYGWIDATSPQSNDYISPWILNTIKDSNPERILDLGCGNGSLCNNIANAGFKAVGVDCDKNGIEIAKKSFNNINFYQSCVEDDPMKVLTLENNELFDMIVSTEVIEHLYAPKKLPQYAYKLLRNNGKLVITTPYHGYLKNLILSIFNKWDHHHTVLWEGGHIKFWSFKTITQLLEDNGFKVIFRGGVGRMPFVWKSMTIIAIKA